MSTSLNGGLAFTVAIKKGKASWFVRENAFQASLLGGTKDPWTWRTPNCSIQKLTGRP